MPIFLYKCLKCGKEKEQIVLSRDKEVKPVCCETEMTKQVATTGRPKIQGGTPIFH